MKLGFDCGKLKFDDCIARNADGKIVGIITGKNVSCPATLPKPFVCTEILDGNEDGSRLQYAVKGEPKTVKSSGPSFTGTASYATA